MPTAGPLLRARLANRSDNPIRNVGNPNIPGAPGLTVSVDLTFQGVNYKPEDIFDALEAKYGSGKIVSDDDTFGRIGPLRLRVTP